MAVNAQRWAAASTRTGSSSSGGSSSPWTLYVTSFSCQLAQPMQQLGGGGRQETWHQAWQQQRAAQSL
jgi:hypothetical protein